MPLTFDLQPGDDRLFTDELLEQIERIEQGLLTLEHGLDAGVVNEVFRAAHTLKGSAATIGHRRMAELTHAMEDLFGAFRSGTLDEVKPFADVLLSTIDVLRSLVAEVQEGEILTDAPEPLTRQLRELLSAATAAAAARSAARPAPVRLARLEPAAEPIEKADRAVAPVSVPDEVEDGVTNIAIAPLIQKLLLDAPGGFEPRSLFVCRINPTSEWQAVRLLQLVLEVEEPGALVGSVPGRDEIESGLGSSLLAILARGRPGELSELRGRLAAIDDVASVEWSRPR